MGTKTIIKTEQRLTEFGYIDGDRTVTTISCEDCIALEYYITDLKQQLAKQAKQLKEADKALEEIGNGHLQEKVSEQIANTYLAKYKGKEN